MVSIEDFMKFHVKNEDGTINESMKIDKGTISKVKDIVDFIRDNNDEKLSDVALEIFVEFAFEFTMDYLNENRDVIIKKNDGETND